MDKGGAKAERGYPGPTRGKFDVKVECESQPTNDKLSLIEAWSGHVTHYKIFGAPIISLEWLSLKS